MAVETGRLVASEEHMSEVADILAAGILRRRKRDMDQSAEKHNRCCDSSTLQEGENR